MLSPRAHAEAMPMMNATHQQAAHHGSHTREEADDQQQPDQ